MHAAALAIGGLLAMQGVAACAEGVVTIRDVKSATAVMSADHHSILVSANVDLPNGCWRNPRVTARPAEAAPDASGTMDIQVVADSTAGPGLACPMIYRPNVPAAPLQWTTFPEGVKAVRLVGERTPVVAPIEP
jgi:hypothetical protein